MGKGILWIEAAAVVILGGGMIALWLSESGRDSVPSSATEAPVRAKEVDALTQSEDPPLFGGGNSESADFPADAADHQRLVGRWLRPDGGYVLDIRAVGDDGTLDAAYLNPKPIHVSRARAGASDGRVEVFVELRDHHYPGNFYTLRYDTDSDRLVGIYHHLGTGQAFDVFFVRLAAND
jgi:hypothetical protein